MAVVLCGCYLFEDRGVAISDNDPFMKILVEFDVVMDSILEPLYPSPVILEPPSPPPAVTGNALNPPPLIVESTPTPFPISPGRVPESETIVRYFLTNDFTAEIAALDELHRNAIQADEESKDKRPDARLWREDSLKSMERSLEIIHETMEIAQKHTGKKTFELTRDEKLLLLDCVWLRHQKMINPTN